MLDTRYIHLHEALGLGAMWLKNTAKIIEPTGVSGSLKPTPTTKKDKNNAAHQKMMAWLHQNRSASEDSPTKNASPPTPLTESAIFSGSVLPARVLVLGLQASLNDFAAQQLFSGEEGVLLRKMLAAIGLQPQDVHLSCWLKTQRPLTMPSREEIFQAAASVRQDWQQSQAKAMLLLGDVFYRDDLKQQILKIVGDSPVFVIPHPSKILENQSLKRPAWEVLQQLQTHLQSSSVAFLPQKNHDKKTTK